MGITHQALNKILKWRKNEISKYRIARELNVHWLTVHRWVIGKHRPGVEISKNILDIEIKN